MDHFTKFLFFASIMVLIFTIFTIIILIRRGYNQDNNVWSIIVSLLIVLYLLTFHLLPILNYYYKKEYVYLVQYQAFKENVSSEKFDITYFENVELDNQSFNILISSKSSSSNFNFDELREILYIYQSYQDDSFLVDKIRYTYSIEGAEPKTCTITFDNYNISQIDFENISKENLISRGKAVVVYENIYDIDESAKDKCFDINYTIKVI